MSERSYSDPENIIAWFVPTVTPKGGAPEKVRDQWVGTPLPVRYANVGLLGRTSIGANVDSFEPSRRTQTVPIRIEDAILALRLCGNALAAEFWGGFKHELDTSIYASTLSFSSVEGEIYTREEVDENIQLTDYFVEQSVK